MSFTFPIYLTIYIFFEKQTHSINQSFGFRGAPSAFVVHTRFLSSNIKYIDLFSGGGVLQVLRAEQVGHAEHAQAGQELQEGTVAFLCFTFAEILEIRK